MKNQSSAAMATPAVNPWVDLVDSNVSDSGKDSACPFHRRASSSSEREDEGGGSGPVKLGRVESVRMASQFLTDPIEAVQRIQERYGNFVVGTLPIPRKNRASQLLIASGAALSREILSQPDTWRTVSISMTGKKNHPSRLLSQGLIRMRGDRHRHYRKLSLPPLRRHRIEGFGEGISQFMVGEVDAWPHDREFDLWDGVKDLMQKTAITFLFADDKEHGCPMAKMVSEAVKASFSKRVNGFPVDLPGTPFAKELRRAEEMEKCIMDWASSKRGQINEGDLLSLIVNEPDEKGEGVEDQDLLGHVPTLLGAAFETCQNAIFWILLLLDQHPQEAWTLLCELERQQEEGELDVKSLDALTYLDGVVKESMRLIPPIPQQFRVSTEDTEVGGYSVKRGARVLLSAFLTNRNPDLFPEPDRFLPERWANLQLNPYEYSVFSAGPRGCPGSWFGMAVVKAAVSTILLRHRMDLSSNDRIDYMVRLALSPKQRVLAKLRPQDGVLRASIFSGTSHNLFRAPGQEDQSGEVVLSS